MNSRSWLHRSQNNQPNQRSTHCRTDDTLAADGVSYRKQTIDPLKGKPETGMDAAALGRDDRPGHPWARGPHAPTLPLPTFAPVRFPASLP